MTIPELHPIFFGCFDWHSSVHGHWLLARAAIMFPHTELAENVSSGQELFLINFKQKSGKVGGLQGRYSPILPDYSWNGLMLKTL